MDTDERLNKLLGKKDNDELNRILGKKGKEKVDEIVCPKCGHKFVEGENGKR